MTRYFTSRAPVQLPDLGREQVEASPLFKKTDLPAGTAAAASIACLEYHPDKKELWASDMRTGELLKSRLGQPLLADARPVEITNPCRIRRLHLDRDDVSEFLVTDLGSFLPEDHDRGGLWRVDSSNPDRVTPILTGVGRVSDVQAADFDGDGDNDLAVAEFGWRRAGSVTVLWNDFDGHASRWRPSKIDNRHGAIDVPVADLNGDGLPDVIALISQEYEQVCGYVNQGNGEFKCVVLFDAGDPSFGCSGIKVVDFDADGDADVILTNGDSFDSGYAKPEHGVRWLENRGAYPFTVREVGPMAGAQCASVADFDGDGDLDITSVSLLPPNPLNVQPGLPSVLWFEHDGDKFRRHVIEVDVPDHACCITLDWDGDGDLDLLTSRFRWSESRGEPISVFLNQSR